MTNYAKRQRMIAAILPIRELAGIPEAKAFVEKHSKPGGKIVDIPEEKWDEVTKAADEHYAKLKAEWDARP